MLAALNFGGGSTIQEADQILLRLAVASLLDASNPSIHFSLTAAQVISETNAALASGNRDTILNLAAQLDTFTNTGGCPLS
jgi:hypothetical protein